MSNAQVSREMQALPGPYVKPQISNKMQVRHAYPLSPAERVQEDSRQKLLMTRNSFPVNH